MDLTTSQINAINARCGDMIVSAGAGSGKTTVLTLRLADRILHMTAEGLTEYFGGYDDYAEAIKNAPEAEKAQKQLSSGAAEYKEKKQLQSELTKARTAVSRAEEAIKKTEAELEAVNDKLASPAYSADYVKAGELSKEAERLQSRLDELYSQWESAEARLMELGFRNQ